MRELDEQARELASKYVDYVKKISHKYEGRGLTYDELVETALEALCDCAVRFNPVRGASFSTFLTLRISGALKNLVDAARPSYKENRRIKYVEMLSLDYIYEVDDEEITLAEMIADNEAEDEACELVGRLLQVLDDDEKELISKKFCLDGERDGFEKLRKTKYADLSDTQLRRRCRKALKKMRDYANGFGKVTIKNKLV